MFEFLTEDVNTSLPPMTQKNPKRLNMVLKRGYIKWNQLWQNLFLFHCQKFSKSITLIPTLGGLRRTKWDSSCLAESWEYIFCIKYKIWSKNKGVKWRINDKRKLRIELMKYDKYRYRQRNVNRKIILLERRNKRGTGGWENFDKSELCVARN